MCVVTHPFSPLRGQSFQVIDRRKRFGSDSLLVVNQNGEWLRLSASWTDLAAADPFVAMCNQRTEFRFEDLMALRQVLDQVGRSSARDESLARGGRLKGK